MARKKPVESTGHLWLEEGEARVGPVAEIAPLLPVWKTYAYPIPSHLEETIKIGQRVMVPIGRSARLIKGFVVGLGHQEWDSTLRPVDSIIEHESFLTPQLIALGRQIAEHYVCPLGRTLKAITPEAVRQLRGLQSVRYARITQPIEELHQRYPGWSKKRWQLLQVLNDHVEPMRVDALLEAADCSAGLLRTIAKDGAVEVETQKEMLAPESSMIPMEKPEYEPNEEQADAIARIRNALDAEKFCVNLLYGVSGSGKTEVYIHAIEHALAAGKQAILLVPEIVLTTQLVHRLLSRLPNIAISHSGLTESQRSLIWRHIASGHYKVVVGTRSAVFAPCHDLGLICIDEEQETSYKNLQAPRFHVRDVAIMRAQQLNIPVVLGSATPSVEMWHYSTQRPDYNRIHLTKRVKDLPMPKVVLVDMQLEQLEQKRTVVVSRAMEQLLGDTLGRKEQGIILMNRRGFASRIRCPSCGTRVTCPNCQVGLVAHRTTGRSVCHYCHQHIVTPTVCPNVNCGEKLVQLGAGTQRVEDVLGDLFADARIRRVDSDTMRHREQYEEIVGDFEKRRIDVLVGTQMIAKGLDFPFVSFVGVVHADADAAVGGFRASERLFQLITQVAGRAGRSDATGRVLVQTTNPDLPALKFALTHDYDAFVAEELEIRKQALMPPFRRLARIVLEHDRADTAASEAESLKGRFAALIDSLEMEYAEVLGPHPCALARLRDRYRYELLIRTGNASLMRKLMVDATHANVLRTRAKTLTIDVDPVSLM